MGRKQEEVRRHGAKQEQFAWGISRRGPPPPSRREEKTRNARNLLVADQRGTWEGRLAYNERQERTEVLYWLRKLQQCWGTRFGLDLVSWRNIIATCVSWLEFLESALMHMLKLCWSCDFSVNSICPCLPSSSPAHSKTKAIRNKYGSSPSQLQHDCRRKNASQLVICLWDQSWATVNPLIICNINQSR